MVACASPIWLVRFLPVLDEPNHLSAIFIWDALTDPASPLHASYALRIAPVSYLLHYGLAWSFAQLIGVEAAHKLVLTFYVAAWPLAAYLWCRASGRSAWLSLWTLPLAFSTCWSHGYHPFNLGMAAFLLGVVAHDRLLNAPSWRIWSGAALASLGCYFGHPLPLALLALCAGLLGSPRRTRRAALWISSACSDFACCRASAATALGEPGPRSCSQEFPISTLRSARRCVTSASTRSPYAARRTRSSSSRCSLWLALLAVTLGLTLRSRRSRADAGLGALLEPAYARCCRAAASGSRSRCSRSSVSPST